MWQFRGREFFRFFAKALVRMINSPASQKPRNRNAFPPKSARISQMPPMVPLELLKYFCGTRGPVPSPTEAPRRPFAPASGQVPQENPPPGRRRLSFGRNEFPAQSEVNIYVNLVSRQEVMFLPKSVFICVHLWLKNRVPAPPAYFRANIGLRLLAVKRSTGGTVME